MIPNQESEMGVMAINLKKSGPGDHYEAQRTKSLLEKIDFKCTKRF